MTSWIQYLYAALAVIVLTLATPIVHIILLQWTRIHNVPPQIPWVGVKKQFFPKVRACLREVTAKRAPLNEGYEKYGKYGQAFILPAMHSPEIILPPSNVHWIASQPENVLSDIKEQDDLVGLDYLAHGPDQAAVHDFSVIRKDLTRQMGNLLPDLLDEMEASFEAGFGSEMDDWKEVEIFKIIQETSRKTSNRVFVGQPLCRDEKYLASLRKWELAFALCGAVIRYLVPYSLKPFLAPIVAIPLYFYRWLVRRRLLPLVRKRIALDSLADKPTAETSRPNDVLQWIVEDNTQHKMSIEDIAGKTVLLNFFAVHTTSMTLGTVLIDIITYASANELISQLRSEAEAIMPKLSDPRCVRDMVMMDSVIRETLRFSPAVGHALQRAVVKPGGVTTPDGLYLPQGTHVSAVVSPMQRDPDLCERGDQYLPLRWYKPVEEQTNLAEKQKTAVQINDGFLSFGLGKHACPGRFFAVQALKVMLGYLLIHCDFELRTERPKFVEIGDGIIPSEKAKIKVRRRKMTEDSKSQFL